MAYTVVVRVAASASDERDGSRAMPMPMRSLRVVRASRVRIRIFTGAPVTSIRAPAFSRVRTLRERHLEERAGAGV